MKSEGPVLRVPKEDGQEVLELLKEEDLLDPERFIETEEQEVIFPLRTTESTLDLDLYGEIEVSDELQIRGQEDTPYQEVRKTLVLPSGKKELLPERWEKLGDIVLIKLPSELYSFKKKIGESYAEVLDAKTVLLQGSIHGTEREPDIEVIYGEETKTVHLENGVQYNIDVSNLMFSSGNIDERKRMAQFDLEGETVVDMFAGIGYFTLPMAVHGKPEKIYSLEINPVACKYLHENVKLNGVERTVDVWHGDNRDFPLSDLADRIVMGYLHDTWKYLPKAKQFIDEEAVIHYHTTCSDEEYPDKVKEELDENIEHFEIENIKNIKSYAPHVFHVVADVHVWV